MLVRDVLPLMRNVKVAFVDEIGNLLWRGPLHEMPEDEGLLPLNVVQLDYHPITHDIMIWVENRDDHFHDIELLLSDCLRAADEGGLVGYVAIMHAARRVAQIAETGFAQAVGR